MPVPSSGSAQSNLLDSTDIAPLPGRKRQRSQSMQSDSEASTSSAKRSVADNSSNDTKARSPLTDQPPTSVPSPDLHQDIDAYMAQSGALHTPPVISPPSYEEIATFTPQEKLEVIQKGKARKMEVGETWYLVSRVWYKRWTKACSREIDKEGPVTEPELGPVDNSALLDVYGNLKNPLVEGVDLEYVPQEAWIFFVEWYGSPAHPLARNVIARGIPKQATIELYPLHLKVFRLVKGSPEFPDVTHPTISISAGETVTSLCTKLSLAVKIGSEDTPYRVWQVGIALDDSEKIEYSASQLPMSDAKIIDSSEKTLTEEGIDSDDSFVVEFKQRDGWIAEAPKAPSQPAPLFNSNEGFFNKMSTSSTAVAPYKSNYFNTPGTSSKTPSVSLTLAGNKSLSKSLEPGTLGLGNMGNTCFMNSALQCLGHTKELTDYFLSGVYEDEINRDNPLGMGGAIAEAFGALLNRMWATSGSSTSHSPREFKMQLQRFAPQFSGYQQHDSQELVAFLLDGLHEDLNRVLKKPYVEKPDWEGGGDVELVGLAQKSWEGYMMRNDSVIVDLFQGQYQSTLVCPECQKVSITFDPFMYLTLPLPVQKKWKHNIFYVPWDLKMPHLKVPIEINRDSGFKDVRALLGRWMGAIPENLLTLEIFNNRFYKNLDDTVPVGDMSDSDVIVCFELPCNARQSRTYKKQASDPAIVPVYLHDAKNRAYYSSNRSTQLFGYPMVVVIDDETARSTEAMYDAVVTRLQRWTENERDLFTWEVGGSGSEIDAVPIRLNGYSPAESVTEIKVQDGEVFTQESQPPPEGDIVDEKRMVIDDEEQDLEDSMPRKTGTKKDIFNLRLQLNHKDYGTPFTGYASNSGWHSWEARQEEADLHPNLLRDDDAFYCEFDEDKKAYYFGDGVRPQHALWDKWELFEHPELEASKRAATEKRNKGISLQDCLDEFTKEEQLGEDDLWYCPQCKKHQQATKKFDLWKAPDILVVHLKRFSNNRTLRDKIDTHVDFPIEGLDLGEMVGERKVAKKLLAQGAKVEELNLGNLDEPLVYDLFAVDEHLGGLGGGHYRAYASNHLTGKWYHFDDSYVTQARASDSVNANAYLLFYRRRSDSPLGGKSFQKIKEAAAREPKQDITALDGADPRSVSLIETQLPTPPNDPMHFRPGQSISLLSELSSRVSHLRENDDAWNLRSADSNAGSSVPSPPADDPPEFEDYTPYPRILLHKNYDYPGFPNSSNKASPTSSNEADADIDTDLEDQGWDPDTSITNLGVGDGLPSPDRSFGWGNGSREELETQWAGTNDPFGDANAQKPDDEDFMDTKHDV